ncbi:aldo/keto reductase [Paracoccus sp. M683]|uniref:aldo/keto reductase n=1 Tax=Paracoccus sp. M683 TaxID=2594268 RepID=UPI0011804F21|nr:aldo/keto reductase [Paracoccus sp. M683]TRW95087.1 aldo/keto reductase [Paracoccus sp. M683]
MQRVKLGASEIEVSEICLGTMTFGRQTDEAEAHAQMDMALQAGITFLDCAEMYPVNPIRRDSIGDSERIIGSWLARTGHRDRVQIATKITGPSQIVNDSQPFDGAAVTRAIDASLVRLGTDRIDLYQLHWPVRGSYAFRQSWNYDPSGQNRERTLDHMRDVLAALAAGVKAGKIRAAGLSNESAWGLTRWIDMAEAGGGPRMAAIQNEYSLLCRPYDTDLAEVAVNEDVTLLAYSPLAAGLLTGKYQQGAVPSDSRAAVDRASGGLGNLGGRKTERALQAVAAYLELAAGAGWDPVHMAISWQLTRPFKLVPIIGATSVVQLDHLIAGLGRRMDRDLAKTIDRLNKAHPLPF